MLDVLLLLLLFRHCAELYVSINDSVYDLRNTHGEKKYGETNTVCYIINAHRLGKQ